MLLYCRSVKKLMVFTLLVMAGLMAVLTVANANVPVSKPRSPVSVSLVPLSPIVAGQPIDFEVQVTVFVDAPVVSVNTVLPRGSILHSGATDWQGGLLQKQSKFFVFRVTLPNQPASPVVVNAAIGGQSTARFSDRAVYLSPQFSAAVAATASSTSRTVLRNGVRVEEYTLR